LTTVANLKSYPLKIMSRLRL